MIGFLSPFPKFFHNSVQEALEPGFETTVTSQRVVTTITGSLAPLGQTHINNPQSWHSSLVKPHGQEGMILKLPCGRYHRKRSPQSDCSASAIESMLWMRSTGLLGPADISAVTSPALVRNPSPGRVTALGSSFWASPALGEHRAPARSPVPARSPARAPCRQYLQ